MTTGKETRVVRVSEQHYDKVMSIANPGEIYNGTDYLPDTFHILINNPNNKAYALEIGDKFVSFNLYTYIDGGKTIVVRAARTHKDYKGRGYSTLVDRYVTMGETTKYIAASTNNDNTAVLDGFQSGLYKKILSMDCFVFILNKNKLFNILGQFTSSSDTSEKAINVEQLGDIFENQVISCQLFPEGRVVVDTVPYRPMKSNADLITTERTTVLLSGEGTSQILLTFGNYFHAHLGLVYNIDMYGCTDKIDEHLLQHLLEILKYTNSEQIFIRIYSREITALDEANIIMNKFGFKKIDLWRSGMFCIETKLEKYLSKL